MHTKQFLTQIALITSIFVSIPVTATAPNSKPRPKSVCYGTTREGRLEHGWQLPAQGENFVAYSQIGGWLQRTYVHSSVYQVITSAYQALSEQRPDTVYMYGETGFEHGGPFKPHKTHQNGLSVDFMVPVINQKNQSVPLPTSLINKLGYAIEFDAAGQFKKYRIDFEAIGAHLLALHQSAQKNGIGIRRVIFDPQLQPYLFATKYGGLLRNKLRFSKRRSWVRHDEHYHVDFSVKCRP